THPHSLHAALPISQWRAELDRICEVPEAGRRWSHRSARGRRARRASMNALTIALVAASLLCRAPAAFAQAEAPAASAEKPAAATLGAAKLAQEFNDP